MRLSSAGRERSDTGKVVNLIASDAEKLVWGSQSLVNVVTLPLQLMIVIVLMFQEMGWPVLVGMLAMVLMFTQIGWFFKRMSQFEREKMKISDKRVKLMSELITGIKVCKYYAWETSFLGRIDEMRKDELGFLRKKSWTQAGFIGVMIAMGMATNVLVFPLYLWQGGVMTTTTLFTTMALFGNLRQPMMQFPQFAQIYAQMKVAIDRLNAFMQEPEIPAAADQPRAELRAGEAVAVQACDLSWGSAKSLLSQKRKEEEEKEKLKKEKKKKSKAERRAEAAARAEEERRQAEEEERKPPLLADASFAIRRGELCCVVGKIGIGKSSLLLGTMGELLTKPARPGARHGYTVEGSVAYVSQTAWIPNATVRDVILFGKPFREDWYWKVVEACALASDLELLPAGDRTEIGERGVVSHRSSLIGVLTSLNKTLLRAESLWRAKAARSPGPRCVRRHRRRHPGRPALGGGPRSSTPHHGALPQGPAQAQDAAAFDPRPAVPPGGRPHPVPRRRADRRAG